MRGPLAPALTRGRDSGVRAASLKVLRVRLRLAHNLGRRPGTLWFRVRRLKEKDARTKRRSGDRRGSGMPPLFGPPPRPREAARSFSAPALPAGKRETRGKPGELRVERELRGLARGSARPGPRAAGARARMLRPGPALPGAPRPWLCAEPPPPLAHTAGCVPGRISEVLGSSLSSLKPRRRKYVGSRGECGARAFNH